MTPETWAKVSALGLAGVLSEATTRRVYPAGGVAANVVGFVRADGTGGGGLEFGLNKELAGTPGSREYEVAGGVRKIATGVEQVSAPVPGPDVRLTIDRDIQWVAQQAIAQRVQEARADSGTVVVMEPSTGRILAMATAPTFNPNTASTAAAGTRGNRAVDEIFEPGSTSKVMTLAAVLEEGAATPDTRLVVPPTLNRSGKTFHDHDEHPTLKLTLTGVLAKSSNIGTILAAEKIGPEMLYSYLKKFGIGESSGLQFPGESRGLLPPPGAVVRHVVPDDRLRPGAGGDVGPGGLGVRDPRQRRRPGASQPGGRLDRRRRHDAATSRRPRGSASSPRRRHARCGR